MEVVLDLAPAKYNNSIHAIVLVEFCLRFHLGYYEFYSVYIAIELASYY